MISGSCVHKLHLTVKLAFVTVELWPEHGGLEERVGGVFLLLPGGKLCRKLPVAVVTLTPDD